VSTYRLHGTPTFDEEIKKKKLILDILLTYIQRKGGWQVFFRKGRKLKRFCQVRKEVLGTSNSLGKPLCILVT